MEFDSYKQCISQKNDSLSIVVFNKNAIFVPPLFHFCFFSIEIRVFRRYRKNHVDIIDNFVVSLDEFFHQMIQFDTHSLFVKSYMKKFEFIQLFQFQDRMKIISTLRSVFINDDKTTFTAVFPSQYNMFTITPFQIILTESMKPKNITIGSAATCCGTRFIAVTGLPADPHFDTRSVLVRDHTLDDRDIFRHAFDQHILALRITPDSLICSFYDHVEIWNLSSSEKVHSIKHAINVHAPLDVSPNFSIMACTGSSPIDLNIFNLKTHESATFRAADNPVSLVSFSENGEYYATTSSAGHAIKVWRTDNNACAAKFKRGTTASVIYSFDFSPSNKFIAILTQNSTLHFFDMRKIGGSAVLTGRVAHRINIGDQSIAHISWFAETQIAIVTMEGRLINIALDEGNYREVGREQILFKNYVTEGVFAAS
ncbi:hypothetical protein TRFO_32741 [Tritrichomonas foetus]|uniref:Anaphase-promoting complex subunit 4 WD40 domain-containing protein n=1 Tax=Tritrichomonas foetus TaxID=1144522 RepID=A0A1J4JN13_9EUKA|nr:hypothetical protein TRFO_32741 [Tritrichomonas foetus]|eukprot:OHT00513.1 hypothetical protein TRFO_32741 [Tritrichomonas foetus]